MLSCYGEVVLPDIENNKDKPDDKGGECHVCIKNLCGIEDKERRRQKRNPKKMKKKFKNCKHGTCSNHLPKKVEDGFLYERFSSSWNLIPFFHLFFSIYLLLINFSSVYS